MRKITLLFLLLTISFSVKAQFTEGFESGIPSDWTVINNGSTNGWVQNTAPSGGALEGTAAASILYDSSLAHDDYLITPAITVATGVNDFLSFSVRSRSSSFLEPYEVLLSTTDTADSSFTVVLQASSEAPSVWMLNSFDLSSYNGQTVYVAIKATGTNEYELFVDDVFNGVQPVAPNCATDPTPADMATEVSTGNVTFTWVAPTSGVAPTSYNLYAGETTDLEYGLIGNYTTESADLTISAYNLTLYWQIVPLNGPSEATGCPIWSFTTEDPPPPPANDDCANAISLTVNSDLACNTVTSGTLLGATDSGVTDNGAGTPNDDVWYRFTATSENHTIEIQNVVGNDTDLVSEVFSGVCGTLTSLNISDPDTNSVNSLTIGDEYYIRVFSYFTTFGIDTTFDICVGTPPPPPANDTLAGAIPITPSVAGTGCSTAGFTLPFSTDGTTDSGMDGTCNNTDTGLDQFFTWTATTDGLLWNDASPGNPGIIIRDTAGNEISCAQTFADDDAVLSGWSVGDNLIIQIYDYGTSVSDVAFCLEEYTIPPPPANDDCANATTVGSLPFNETMDANASTNNAGFISECGSGMNDGVWYTFTTVDAGTIDIAITGVTGWDPEVALYTGSCGTFTCVDSADGGGSGGNETLSGVTVTAATQYWINIGHWNGGTDNSEGPFTIDISTTDTTTLKVESNSIENFTLFPTIVKDKLSFTSQENIDVLTIYNIMGQEVLSRKPTITNGSINISSLSSGMYIVKVKAGNSLGSYKIIKE